MSPLLAESPSTEPSPQIHRLSRKFGSLGRSYVLLGAAWAPHLAHVREDASSYACRGGRPSVTLEDTPVPTVM